MATALSGDGFARANPFKALGFEAPSSMKVRPVEDEAGAARKLAAAAAKAKGASAATKSAAKALALAAGEVEKALAPLAKLKAARAAAIAERDALGLRWEKALATLRRFAQADEGDAYGLLFRATAVRGAKRSGKKATEKKPGVPSKPATGSSDAS